MVELGRLGVFRRYTALSPELAATLERLGYGAIWVGGSPGDLRQVEELLDATSAIAVATGIVSIWADGPRDVAASYYRIEERHPGRFLLGIGAGHREMTGARHTKPYAALAGYLDELDAAGVPVQDRVLAALGPRVLKLSAERSAGAHPFLVTPEHTRRARSILGSGPLLAPEQKVVLQADPARGRSIGRAAVEAPLGLVNYNRSLRTLGFGDDDLAGGGSDRLIDALVIHGDTAAVTAGLAAHLEAGADHVAVNLITAQGDDPVAGFTALAGALPR